MEEVQWVQLLPFILCDAFCISGRKQGLFEMSSTCCVHPIAKGVFRPLLRTLFKLARLVAGVAKPKFP